jgi:spore germination protein
VVRPGPIGPITWAKKVIDHARSVGVPPSKLVLGISLYGRSWPGGRNLGATSARKLARTTGATIRFDPVLGESWFKAAGTTVWFPDARSVEAKVAFAREQGLGGVACFSFTWATAEHTDALARARRPGSLVAAVPAR